MAKENWLMVPTRFKPETLRAIEQITDWTTHVHINGHPYVWVIEKILARAPRLLQLRVVPSGYGKLNPDTHLKACAKRGVDVVQGYSEPNMAWEVTGQNGGQLPRYQEQRALFLGMNAETRQRFDELCELGLEAALMVRRYFRFDDETFVPQRAIHRTFAPKDQVDNPSLVSCRVSAMMKHLGLVADISPTAEKYHRSIKRRTEKLRKEQKANLAMEAMVRAINVPRLPSDMPLSEYDAFAQVVEKLASPEMAALRQSDQRRHQLILRRYGLEDWESKGTIGAYRKMRELGDSGGGICRERVRQLLEQDLEQLGIQKTRSPKSRRGPSEK